MKSKQPVAKPGDGIAAHIAAQPPKVRAILRKIRATIRKAAPGATEAISYGIPAFKLHGNLIFYAAHKTHIGIYPRVPELKDELAKYAGGKGNVQLRLDKPIPYGLIALMAKCRVKDNQQRAAAKKKK
jgi:uncharacterized protein YdhG (YjbR/CyaY superfamily)